MKKKGLFKIILCSILLVVVLSFAIPTSSDGTRNFLGLGTVALNIIQSLAYFTDTVLLILVIGGFYGVLNKTGGYKKLLDKIATKYKDNRNFLIFVIILFGLVAALTGISLPLIVFVPFVISIILLMGYDKLVALSATIGSMLIGLMGGLFITFVDSNAYSYTLTTMEKVLSLDANSNILYKILLLVFALGLLILYVLKHIKNVKDKKVKYDIKDDTDILITEVKGSYKNIKVWPLITVFSLMFGLLILGLVPWNSLFNIKVFNDIHTFMTTKLVIGKFNVYTSIVSGLFPAFGEWGSIGNVGNYLMVINLILMLTIVVTICYKIKFEDAVDGFVDGLKKMLPTVALVILANTVLICSFNIGLTNKIIDWAMGLVGGFNIIVVALLTMIASFFSVDFFYTLVGGFSIITGLVKDTSVYPLLDVMYQSFYYLIMLVGPTSIILIIGLTYLNVPYKEWLKYIWRLLLELFILIFAVLCLMLIL